MEESTRGSLVVVDLGETLGGLKEEDLQEQKKIAEELGLEEQIERVKEKQDILKASKEMEDCLLVANARKANSWGERVKEGKFRRLPDVKSRGRKVQRFYRAVPLAEFKEEIPLLILRKIEKVGGYFDEIEIWVRTNIREKDPYVVGVKHNKFFLICYWDEDESLF